MKKVELVYNVYHENSNRRKIEVVNILGYSVVKKKLDELRKLYRKGLKKFLSEVGSQSVGSKTLIPK